MTPRMCAASGFASLASRPSGRRPRSRGVPARRRPSPRALRRCRRAPAPGIAGGPHRPWRNRRGRRRGRARPPGRRRARGARVTERRRVRPGVESGDRAIVCSNDALVAGAINASASVVAAATGSARNERQAPRPPTRNNVAASAATPIDRLTLMCCRPPREMVVGERRAKRAALIDGCYLRRPAECGSAMYGNEPPKPCRSRRRASPRPCLGADELALDDLQRDVHDVVGEPAAVREARRCHRRDAEPVGRCGADRSRC